MKTIFMGTPDFAVPCLKALAESTHEVMAVFTQPDKPKGRGYKMIPTPVKTAAAEYDIPESPYWLLPNHISCCKDSVF